MYVYYTGTCRLKDNRQVYIVVPSEVHEVVLVDIGDIQLVHFTNLQKIINNVYMYIRRWHHISLAVPLEHLRELMIPHLLGYDEYKAVSSKNNIIIAFTVNFG